MKCPGQDTQYWQPGDIYEVSCPDCGRKIEFFKDDVSRRCKDCGIRITNPKLDFGCAETCAYAEQCLAGISSEDTERGAKTERGAPNSHKEKGA